MTQNTVSEVEYYSEANVTVPEFEFKLSWIWIKRFWKLFRLFPRSLKYFGNPLHHYSG